MGACKPVGTINCGAVSCDAVDGCRTPCTVDKDCPSSSYCNLSTTRCAALKIDGAACDKPSECSSGFCADGVCCNSACTDKCTACSASLTTQKSGICAAVKVGTDPHDSCAVDTNNECGTDGTCDGAGACRMTGTDHECKPGSCTAGTFTHAASCDGKGACGPVASETCATLACNAVTGCQKACTGDSDCSDKSFCDLASKACTAKRDNGKACKAGTECTSGNCVDGMCCNSKCDTPCSSCKTAHTNDTDGLCASVSKGLDPYASCQDETATNPCGNTGSCNGAGSCQKTEKGKECHTPFLQRQHLHAGGYLRRARRLQGREHDQLRGLSVPARHRVPDDLHEEQRLLQHHLLRHRPGQACLRPQKEAGRAVWNRRRQVRLGPLRGRRVL